MKKSLVWLLLILGFSASAQGVYPHQFTELTNLTDSNWETYTQKSGLPRRISPANMSAYFLKGVRAYVSGDVLYFSRRDSISSVDLSSYKQSLSVAQNGSGQTTITISDGNTITLPAATVGDIEVESPLEGIGTTGDPIGIATGGIATAKLADNAVTFAKIQTIPTQTLMGRYSSGTGAVQSITLGDGLALSVGGVLSSDVSLKKDTFISLYDQDFNIFSIPTPSRLNTVYIGSGSSTGDTSKVSFTGSINYDSHKEVVFRIKNDFRNTMVDFRSAQVALSTSRQIYYLKTNQVLDVRLTYDTDYGAYRWGVNLLWDSIPAGGGGASDGNGIYDGSGTLPNDTVKVTNTLRFKLKDPSNSNGTTFFNRAKSTYSFIPDSYTDSLNQGFLIKKGLDSAAVAIDKDGNLQILSDEWLTIGNTQAKIIVRDNDGGVRFQFGADGYTFPNDDPSNVASMGNSQSIMGFTTAGAGKWVNFDTEVRARLKKDTFITVPHSTNYIPNLVITTPSRFYNNIYLSCKGVTDTSVVAFLAAPTSDHYGVVYNIKNDSGLVETRILSDAHSANVKTLYTLKRGQMAQVRAIKDQENSNAYRWAVNLLWDSTAVSSGGSSISEYNVTVTSGNSGSNLRVVATGSGVTASYASNKLTVVIPNGVTLLSADWRLVSGDIQASGDAGGVTNWVQVEFQGTGGNTGISDIRIPTVQKTSIPTSGSLSVTNAASLDIDNNPAATVVGVGSGNITLRVGGLASGSQGYHLKFNGL